MTWKIVLLWLILTFFLTAASPHLDLPPLIEDTQVPPGFYLIDASIGWEMYRKDYQEGNPDFVQIIRLDKGAGIELLTSDIAKSGTDRGAYGGDNPKFFSRSLEDYWWEISNNNINAVCVTNGSFFYMPEHPTKLAGFLLRRVALNVQGPSRRLRESPERRDTSPACFRL